MIEGKILYFRDETVCIIKMQGGITFQLGPDFDRFLQKVAASKGLQSLIIDLTQANYIDSTSLGLIARIYEISNEKKMQHPIIISSNADINDIIYNVGFHKIFSIINSLENVPKTLEELPHSEIQQKQLSSVMLQAHRCLANLNTSNSEKFKDVIDYIEHDLA